MASKKKGEKKPLNIEVMLIKIRGVITEPKCWSAKHFGNFAVHIAPKRYTMDVKFLFEAEWTHMKRQLIDENVQVPGMGEAECAVWVNDAYVGDDIGLGKFLNQDGYINKSLMYQMLNVHVKISTNPLDYCPRNLQRTYVHFSVIVNGKKIGKLLFEMFTDIMPLSCLRFLKECRRYEGCPVHRIAQNGWFESGQFDLEDPPMRERRPAGLSNYREGMLSLVNYGKCNKKSSQFLVTLVPAPQLDPYQCPIGALLDGISVLKTINDIQTHYDSPLSKINLAEVTIFYTPSELAVKNHLNCTDPVDAPADIWLQDEYIRKSEDDEEVKAYRLDLKPDFTVKPTDVEQSLKEIKRKLYEENNKLIEIIGETELTLIIENILKTKTSSGKMESDMRKAKDKDEQLWYNTLVNADKEFDINYTVDILPKLCDKTKDSWLKKSATIENPIIVRLIQLLHKKELNTVLGLINRLVHAAIEEAFKSADQTLHKKVASDFDYSRPLGNDMDRLPGSIQELLIDEACKLSNSAFELFGLTLQHILESLSDTKLNKDTSSISGNLLKIIELNNIYLDLKELSIEEILERKEVLQGDVLLLEKSIQSIHRRSKSEPIPTISKAKPPTKSTITF